MWKGKRRGVKRALVRRPNRKYRSRVRIRRNPGNGGFFIQRKLIAPLYIRPSGVGTVTTNDTTLLKLGAPILTGMGIGGSYDVPFAFEFNLSQLAQHTDIANICDRYKITSVNICAQYNMSNGANVGPTNPTFIQYVLDFDDSVPPSSLSELQAHMGLKNKGFNSNGQIWMKTWPKVAPEIYNSPTTTAYQVPRSMFINTSSVVTPHFGLKGVFRNMYLLGALSGTALTFDVTFNVVCKGLQ